MTYSRVILLACVLLAAGCRRQTEISVREFFKNPDSCAYRLSPNGSQIAFLKPAGKSHRLNLFVQSLAGGAAKSVTSEEDRDIAQRYIWKGEDQIVYFVDLVADQKCEWHVRCVDLKAEGNRVQDRTPCPLTDIIDELRDVPDQILVAVNGSVYRLNILTGCTDLVEQNPGDVAQWVTDKDGNVRAALSGDGVTLCLLTRQEHDVEFRQVLEMDFRESIFPTSYTFGEMGRATPFRFVTGTTVFLPGEKGGKPGLYALSNMKKKDGTPRDKYALVRIGLQNGEEIDDIYANADFDVDNIEASADGRVISAKFESWRDERHSLDLENGSMFGQLESQFPNDDVVITAYDRQGTKLIVERSSDQNPGEFYLFERAKGGLRKVKKLGERAPQLRNHLAPMTPIFFPSRDQRTINGYLTLPLGPKRTDLPLIVVPHGGPDWRNVWGFSRENREVQFFANRGYAVLQVNFRGSTGYGREFWEAGFKQWGQAMQNDITDGVLWAIGQKIADPKRIAIVGESYGGYAALAGITFTEEVHYAAAVDRAGLSDLLVLLAEYPKSAFPELRIKIGDPDQESEREILKYFSPALQAQRISTPLLIAQGKYDGVVDPDQSTEMRNALANQGIHIKTLCLPEGHIFQNEENLIAYYEAVDAFLKEHLK